LKPGVKLHLSHPERLSLLGELPAEVSQEASSPQATAVVLFADDQASFAALLDATFENVPLSALLWVLYPKGNRTDLNRDSLWPMLAVRGWRPITQVAVDDVWSALRFRPLKAGEPPFNPSR
jgi:hypothetical protein